MAYIIYTLWLVISKCIVLTPTIYPLDSQICSTEIPLRILMYFMFTRYIISIAMYCRSTSNMAVSSMMDKAFDSRRASGDGRRVSAAAGSVVQPPCLHKAS